MTRKTLTYVFLLFFINSWVAGQETKADSTANLYEMTLEDLMSLEVFTSNKKLENILQTPAYVNVLTADEIRNLNFNTLEEVLEFNVGLSTTSAEGNKFPSTTIRGNTITTYNVNTLLLFDGNPIYNPYHGSFNLATIPLSSIERIEIVKGANSVLYGTNAINAVINIIPKKLKEDGTSIQGRIKGGSQLTGVANHAILFKEGDFSVNTYVDALTTKGQEHTYFNQNDGSQFQLNKNIVHRNLASIIEYKGLKANILYTNIRDKPTENNRLDQFYHFSRSDTFDIQLPEATDEYQLVAGISYLHTFNDNFNLTGNFQYQNWELTASTPSLARIYLSTSYRGVLESSFKVKKHTSGIFGLEYNNYLGKRERDGIRNGERIMSIDVNPEELVFEDVAAYLNAKTTLTDKLTAYYGVRFYTSSFGGNSSQNISPRLALTYSLKNNLVVKGIYGRSFRVPMTFERASISNTAGGNPGLNPETSTSFDLLISGTSKFIQWDLDLFYMQINDKIVRVEADDRAREITDNPDLVRWYENRDAFNYKGAEFNSKFNFNNKLTGLLGYAYVHADHPENDTTTLGDDPWYYEHMLNIGLSYKPHEQFNITTSFKYMSDFGFGPGYGSVAPSYAVANIGLNIYPLKNRDLRLELKVDNLTDTEILRPEISNRRLETAPTIPYAFSRRFMIGLSYNL